MIVLMQYDELEDLGFQGFAIGFHKEYTQIVGTSQSSKVFSADSKIVEYARAQFVIAGLY